MGIATGRGCLNYALRGPIADEEVPVIRLLFIGPTLYANSTPSLVYASVFPFYGAVTLTLALLSSSLVEWVYSSLYKIAPKLVQKSLRGIDTKIDTSAASLSDKYFFFQDKKGAVAIFGLLGLYIAFYFLALIF